MDHLPYWQVNVPIDQRTRECPPYLKDLTDKDIRTLSTPDSDFQIQSWEQVRHSVSNNQLDHFQRWPSDLRRYRHFVYRLLLRYGSVADFILSHRLQWQEPLLAASEVPFACADDFRILMNDWPYGLDPRIVHLVVWTKFRLLEDPVTEDLTSEARQEIDAFVENTFRSRCKPGTVLWFRNWSAIKSVHAVEHFHVMIYDPDPDFIKQITNADVPQSDRAEL